MSAARSQPLCRERTAWSGTPPGFPRPVPCGSVSCRVSGRRASAAPFRRSPSRSVRTRSLFSRLSTWFQKRYNPFQAACFLTQHHPLQHVQERRACFPAPFGRHSPERKCNPSVRWCAVCPKSSPCPAGQRTASRNLRSSVSSRCHVRGLFHPALLYRIGGTPRLTHLLVCHPFQVLVFQYRPAVPLPHLVQAVLRKVAVDHRQRTPAVVVQVACYQYRNRRTFPLPPFCVAKATFNVCLSISSIN